MAELLRPYAQYLEAHRVAHLATASQQGVPHVIPICYAFDGRAVFSVMDEKPKAVAPGRLKRLRNIGANPRVALLVDDYDEDWSRLGYLLVHGRADLVEAQAEHAAALGLLRRRYPQYRDMGLENRPLLRIMPLKVTAWGTAAAGQ